MGNWKNRRRFFYHQYNDPATSYYNHRGPPPPLPGFAEDGVPLWEKKFCSLIESVPWQKIVNAKEFMHYHDSVMSWDDSAGEDAFQNAKKRFWAETNFLPCQISVPDPDMYIDEINWHPDIDPELVKDLEQAFFAPEEGEDGNVECNNKKTRDLVSIPSEGWNRNPDEVSTPWECDNKVGSDLALKDKAQGWNLWQNITNNSCKVNNGDTQWGRCHPHGNEAVDGKTWGNWGDKLQRRNDSVNHVHQVKDWDNGNLINDDNPWDCSVTQSDAVKGNTWEDSSNKLWEWNHSQDQVNQLREWDSGKNYRELSSQEKAWGYNKQELGKYSNGVNSGQGKFTQGSRNPKDRQWRGSEGNEQGWGRWNNPYRDPKDLEIRQSDGGGGTWNNNGGRRTWNDNDGHRKREGNHRYMTGNKHTRYQGNDYEAGHLWNGGATKRRVTFGYE